MERLTAILRTLKRKGTDFCTLDGLAETAQATREDVACDLKLLQEQKYNIEINPSLGIRLIDVPDVLYPYEVLSEMDSLAWLQGSLNVVYSPELSSTNEIAKHLARQDASDGTVVVTDYQTKGKGRQGRHWFSPPGTNLLFSIILRPTIAARRLPFLTVMTSTAVAAALRDEYGLAVGLKWPNDLVLEGKKLGGILTEGEGLEGNVHFAVIGIGLNVNCPMDALPNEIAAGATSLISNLGHPVHRAHVLAVVMQRLKRFYEELLFGSSETILEMCKQLSDTIGKYVQIGSASAGYAEDIDQEGALVLRLENGMRKHIWVGDLTQLF